MKVILFTTFLLFSVNGFAFNWKKVIENTNGHSFYVDVDNIKKHNGLVYYWQLRDFLEPFYGDYSSISKGKFDCVEEKQTFLSTTFYSQPMGKGQITTETTPIRVIYPKPQSVSYHVMKFVCDTAK